VARAIQHIEVRRLHVFFDLSQPLWEYSPKWVFQPEVAFVDLRQVVRDGLTSRAISTSLHAGTHIDAPSHFPGGSMRTVEGIPIAQLCGPGVVLSLKRDAWGAITAEDLEAATPAIRPGDRVILNTGWHEHFGVDDETFMLRYPGLDKSGVDWLVAKGVSWVGSDTPSPDHAYCLSGLIEKHRRDIFDDAVLSGIDRDRFPKAYCHRTLLANDIPMVEQLGGQIDEVTGHRVEVFALPPKLQFAEAAQVRVIARIVEE
jgi:kynurenine formamidase